METTLGIIAIIISLTSFVMSTFFAVRSLKSNARSNELSESQKTAALISIIAPACQEPEQWKLFIKYLSENNRLPNFTDDDEDFLNNILSRLEIKAIIINGKIKVEG